MSVLADWNSIDWAKVQSRVTIHQHRIYKASLNKEYGKMHRLQKLLTRSINAKLLAVRRVTTDNRGKRTSLLAMKGVDGIVITSSGKKLELARSLSLSGKAYKILSVFIDKAGKKKKRLLGIPIIEDRANQALATMVLEPQWEAHFEPNSYGFRPGRSAQDAVEAIFNTLRVGRKYVLYADISKSFDTIDHDALLGKLETYPEMRIQIGAWLKAGVMDQLNYNSQATVEETMSGTSEGGIISPLLTNIALHSLENAIEENFSTNRLKASVIRYADDFVMIHRSKEVVKSMQAFSIIWLSSMGLELSPSKTRLVYSSEGFDFLGFHFIHLGKDDCRRTKITPSKASQSSLLSNLKKEVSSLKGVATHVLIGRLTPKIVGWGNYFRTGECADVFRSLDHRIYQMIRPWVFRRHPTWGRMKIKEKYFPEGKSWKYGDKLHRNNWVLSDCITKPSGEVVVSYLPKLAWIHSKKHVKVKATRSPFDGDTVYWSLRLSNYSPLGITVTKLLRAQKGICARCNTRFTVTDLMDIDHIIPLSKGGKNTYANRQLLHRHCHIFKTKDDLKVA